MFLLSVLSGCGSEENSPLVGKWVATSAMINGETIMFSELNTEDREFSFTFEKNGKCTAVLAGISNDGTYTFNKTSVDITYGRKTEKLTYNSGVLTLNFNYNNETTSFMFTKASN
jgi:hypothetical protein